MKKNKKQQLRKLKEEKIAQMEYEDANGILRRKEIAPTDFMTPKKLMGMKIFLLCCMLVSFFVYSLLLLPLCLLYALLYFAAKRIEKKANHGMKKSLCVTVPKFDSVIAMLLICTAVFGATLSMATTSNKTSELDAVISPTKRYALQVSTLYTGHRELFVSKNIVVFGFGLNVGGGFESPADAGHIAPESCPLHTEGNEGVFLNTGECPAASDIPLTNMFSQILMVLGIMMLVIVMSSGVYVFLKTKKLKL